MIPLLTSVIPGPYRILAMLAGAALLFLSGLYVGWDWRAGKEARRDAREAARVLEFRAIMQQNSDSIAARTEAAIGNIRTETRIINKAVEREIQEKPVYLNGDCIVPASGVRLLNQARGFAEPSQ